MLNDTPRNEAYRNAILSNQDIFAGKTVLDVGTGTGNVRIKYDFSTFRDQSLI